MRHLPAARSGKTSTSTRLYSPRGRSVRGLQGALFSCARDERLREGELVGEVAIVGNREQILAVDKQRGNARQAHRAGEVVRALRLQLDAEGTVGVLELRAIDPLPRNPVRDAGFIVQRLALLVY